MILSHGMGASSYVPDALIGAAQDEVDFGLVAFLQCYAREPGEWDLLMLLAENEGWLTPGRLAMMLGETRKVVNQKLESLVARKLIEERVLIVGPSYRLVPSEQLRRRVIRLAKTLREGSTLSL
jgi:predicted transcriptional regulator